MAGGSNYPGFEPELVMTSFPTDRQLEAYAKSVIKTFKHLSAEEALYCGSAMRSLGQDWPDKTMRKIIEPAAGIVGVIFVSLMERDLERRGLPLDYFAKEDPSHGR